MRFVLTFKYPLTATANMTFIYITNESTPTTKDSCSPSAPRIHIDKNKCYRIYYVYIQYTILKGIEHNK